MIARKMLCVMACAGVLSGCVRMSRGADIEPIEYLNAARTESMTVENLMGMVLGHGSVYPRITSPGQRDVVDEGVFDELTDCSDGNYRCIRTALEVFAVPKDPFQASTRYTTQGAVFEVERCLRSTDKRCQVALIRCVCKWNAAERRCGFGGTEPDSSPLVFIYNEDFGVTSFGHMGSSTTASTDPVATASQWILKGKRGLLAPEL